MIVAFTKDWNDVPTCTTHILREMAKTIPVLWIESIGTRKPQIAAGHKDIGRIFGRLKRALAGPDWKENQLWVLAPLLVPKATSGLQVRINRILFRLQERAAQRKMLRRSSPTSDLRPPTSEYWCFVPNAVDLLPLPSPKQRVIYYCVDDWTQFHNLDGEYLGRKERQLVTRADTIFAASRFLADKLQQTVTSSSSGSRIADPASAPKVHYMPHGVEHAKFAAALTPETATPVDVSRIPHPIIGFYGNLHSWVDVRLIADLAAACQDWQFVLIGHPYDDVSPVESLPNVHLLGRREHDELPAYCRAFDVAVIPYDMSSNRMESVNPVKTKELLAAGLPVVASAVPELAGMEPDVVIARSVAEWLSAIEAQLSREDRQAISRRVKQEDWVEKVTEIRGLVDRAGWREQP